MKTATRSAAIIASAILTFVMTNSTMAADIDRQPLSAATAPVIFAPAAPPPISLIPIEVPTAPTRSLSELVAAQTEAASPNADQECIAAAVYFEARGEPIEGQLAVAQVVLNRAASGKYPADICDVVTQRAQFSFVRRHRIPRIPRATEAWRIAVAIAQIARDNVIQQIGSDVLWYHANYVRPGWGSRLTRVSKIGTHIFYSATS